jgi:hypothetical protein
MLRDPDKASPLTRLLDVEVLLAEGLADAYRARGDELVGVALQAVRDRFLYRAAGAATFAEWCAGLRGRGVALDPAAVDGYLAGVAWAERAAVAVRAAERRHLTD